MMLSRGLLGAAMLVGMTQPGLAQTIRRTFRSVPDAVRYVEDIRIVVAFAEACRVDARQGQRVNQAALMEAGQGMSIRERVELVNALAASTAGTDIICTRGPSRAEDLARAKAVLGLR